MKRTRASRAQRRIQRQRHRAAAKTAKRELKQRDLAGKHAALQHDIRQRVADKVRAHRDKAPGKRRRPSRWWLLVLLLILLLLFLRPCQCNPEPEAGPAPRLIQEPVPAEVADVAPVEPTRKKLPRIARPALQAPPPAPPSWLDVFRMQVAARSPRLSACIEGADNPGTLKWTTSVEPVQGSVSQHKLEPMLQTAELTNAERDCIIGVLQRPGYRLPTQGAPSTPRRVGLVIEF